MRDETRKALDDLERAMLADPKVGRELWDILTALRGPDLGGWTKAVTDLENVAKGYTVAVRRAAFPNLASCVEHDESHIALFGYVNGLVKPEPTKCALTQLEPKIGSVMAETKHPPEFGWTHFCNHVERAMYACGDKPLEVPK